jgi:ubiquinone/menaquinone biosynthesis C-methylase UbiE
MGQLRNFVTPLHTSSKRNYLERMNNNKPYCMEVAKKYGKDYWDGDRKFGYGGYRYIKDRWKSVAQALIETYEIKSGMKVLDIGCGKGFLIYEMLKINPDIQITGIDISQYAINNSKPEIKSLLKRFDIRNYLPFKDNEFDLAISLGTLHNLKLHELKIAIPELERVSMQGYIMLESYRNNNELSNLQCWALTCETFLDKDSWIKFYKSEKYSGDYEFIYFE